MVMTYLAWAFLALNAVMAAIGIYYGLKLSALGATYARNPTWWMFVWQAIGVVLVLLLRWSPWHLLWWLFVGTVIGGAVKAYLWSQQRHYRTPG